MIKIMRNPRVDNETWAKGTFSNQHSNKEICLGQKRWGGVKKGAKNGSEMQTEIQLQEKTHPSPHIFNVRPSHHGTCVIRRAASYDQKKGGDKEAKTTYAASHP